MKWFYVVRGFDVEDQDFKTLKEARKEAALLKQEGENPEILKATKVSK